MAWSGGCFDHFEILRLGMDVTHPDPWINRSLYPGRLSEELI
jgi:hypothetical protein